MVIWENMFNEPIVFRERTRKSNAGQYLRTGQEHAEYGVIGRAWDCRRDDTPQ